MKKLAAVTLILLALGSFVFADDAKVMPKMVGRVYIAPTLSVAPGYYNADGEYKSFDDGSVKAFNLGFALEYGVIDWITAAIQWAPGVTVWSDLSPAMAAQLDQIALMNGGKKSEVNTNGVADLFAGAKIQILGENAPVKTSMFRAAIAPGLIIPMPGPDFADQAGNLLKGDKATVSNMDKHVWTTGARLYFDWVINEYFFINLYNESLFHLSKRDMDEDGPNLALTKKGLAMHPQLGQAISAVPQLASAVNGVSGEVNYKYKLTFELEPVFSMPLAEGISFTAGLPVNFVYNPAPEYSLSGLDAFDNFAAYGGDQIKEQFTNLEKGDDAYLLSLRPNVSVFLTRLPLPLEFKLSYQAPLAGKNRSAAQHNITLQIKVYFALPGRK